MGPLYGPGEFPYPPLPPSQLRPVRPVRACRVVAWASDSGVQMSETRRRKEAHRRCRRPGLGLICCLKEKIEKKKKKIQQCKKIIFKTLPTLYDQGIYLYIWAVVEFQQLDPVQYQKMYVNKNQDLGPFFFFFFFFFLVRAKVRHA